MFSEPVPEKNGPALSPLAFTKTERLFGVGSGITISLTSGMTTPPLK